MLTVIPDAATRLRLLGERYAVTRNGHHIGDLMPVRRRRRAVSRAEFTAVSRGMPRLDDRKYREDMDRHVNDEFYDRAHGRGVVPENDERPPGTHPDVTARLAEIHTLRPRTPGRPIDHRFDPVHHGRRAFGPVRFCGSHDG
ncbi:hypothetical protein GCM10017673_09350 [Streptosporangium violaceochromogenes]|nr:hypothetical protein GCM10017673_09350 [Streptosporangium violaceochromogenes]